LFAGRAAGDQSPVTGRRSGRREHGGWREGRRGLCGRGRRRFHGGSGCGNAERGLDLDLGGGLCGPSGLGRRRRLGLGLAAEPELVGLPPDPIGLGVLDARGVALDSDPEIGAEVKSLLVRQPKLTRKLIDADFLRQPRISPRSAPPTRR